MTPLASALLLLAAGPQADVPPEAGCVVCHRAGTRSLSSSSHASLLPGSAATQPMPRFGDRRAFSRDAACALCHGPGAEHVAEAKARRHRPGTYPIPREACARCHAGSAELHRAVPEFRPESACEGCHRVHTPARSGGGRTEAEGGRAAAPSPRSRLGPFAVEGALEAGFRVVRVGGDEGQFRQDVNLEGGPRLLGARIEGRAIEDAPFDSFRFSTRGAGDPQRGARLEAEREGRWRARADWRSAESVFASESDFHERRARRGEVSVALATDPRYPDEPLVGLDLGQARLRGEEKGTLFLNPLLLYSGNDLLRPPRSPEDLDATMRTVGGTLRFLLLGFGVFLRPEWRETLEEPSARLRGTSTVATNVVVTERDFEARSRARSPSLAARVSRSFAGGGIDLDVGLRHGETDVSADLDERIAGTIAGAPFTRTANAHARSRGRVSEIDAETRLRPLEGVELRLRALRREEDEEGRSRTSLLLSTLGFPVDLPFETRFESLSLTGEAELRLRAAEPLDLRMGWRRTAQDLEFVGSTFPGVAPPPDRLVTQGPTAGITLRPAASWSFDLDLFAVDTDEALYEIQAERGLTLRAKLRGRVTRDLSVLLVGAWRRAEVEGFVGEFGDVLDAERTIDAETLSLRWRAGPGAILSAGYGRRRTLLEADAVFPVAGGVTTQGESEFDGVAHVLTGSAELDLSERLTASGAAVYENASGDTAFRFQNLLARLEYEISRAATVGSEVRFVEFAPGEGRPGAGDGTDAWIGLLFARISF